MKLKQVKNKYFFTPKYINMKNWLTVLLLAVNFAAFSQDRLILKNQSEYQVNIISVLQNDILFKAWQSSDTTTYSINKSEVSAIVYRNGQRVSITVESAIPQSATPNYQQPSVGSPQGSYVPMPNYNQPQTTSEVTTNYDLEHTFVPMSKEFKNMPKSEIKRIRKDRELFKQYRGDASLSIGVNVMSIGKSTMPTLMVYDDIVIAKNVSLTFGVGYSLDIEKVYDYKYKLYSMFFLLGGNYYFNQLLKIKKEKASLYSGIFLTPTYSIFSIKDPTGYASSSSSSFSFNGGIRIGGGYNFSKVVGVCGDVFIGKGRPGITLGIRFNGLRLN
jgi:hypothetical protein